MSKSVYFLSNNKKPNLYYRMVKADHPVFTSRSSARKALAKLKAATVSNPNQWKIFKVSTVNVR